MSNRVLPLFLVALAVAVLTAAPVFAEAKADAKTHSGKVVRVEGNKLVMVDKSGKNEHTHTLAADATITCNGKQCKATDLKPGMFITVTTKDNGKIAVRVDAKKGKGGDK